MACPRCGFRNPAGFRFCGSCGAALPPDQPAPAFVLEGADAERRQLTVMFCDMVGSTALAERVDPEEMREILLEYRDTVVGQIRRFDGHVAKYLGDGVVVYFGYPLAHEDDALRAVQAGVGLVEAMGRLGARLAGEGRPRLEARVGIHTGLVVAGEIGAGQDAESLAIVGPTPNVAARLEEIAEPNTVVISAATQRLVEGYFTVADLGRVPLKGIGEPVRVFRVLASTGAQSRMDLIRQTIGLAPLIGRERELAALREAWARAWAGAGQAVLLEGEAGIGKSRLVLGLEEALHETPHRRLVCGGSAHHRNTAFHPLVDLLQRELGLDRADSVEGRLERLGRRLAQQGRGDPDTVALFASILGLLPQAPQPDLDAGRRKQRTLEAVAGWLWSLAEQSPVLLVVEDLHWIDPSTLELLEAVVDQIPTRRVLLVMTARPPFPAGRAGAHVTRLPVGRLSAGQAEAMAGRIAGKAVVSWSIMKEIAERADGVPLFIEELTQMILRSDPDAAPHEVEIPRTLSDLLMARLDRVGTAKEVAQLAAMLGREFTYELLEAIAPIDAPALQWEVDVLVQSGLLLQYGEPPHAWYFFKHALIQEVAYQSLLRRTRERYHRRIAGVMASRFPEVAEEEPELLAHHYAAAGEPAKAVDLWIRAGQKSIEASAYAEAIGHLSQARGAIEDGSQRELEVLAALGPAVMVTRGWAAPEVEEIYDRALAICRQDGDVARLGPALYGLFAVHFIRGQHRRAEELADELIALGEIQPDPGVLLEGHVARLATDFWSGDPARAVAHFERVRELYDPVRHFGHARLYGRDPMVSALAHAGLARWMMGAADAGLELMLEALSEAHRLSQPFTQAWALCFLAFLHAEREEWEAARQRAEEVVALASQRQRFAFWFDWGSFILGRIQAATGDWAGGATRMVRALDEYRRSGAGIARPYFEALTAFALARASGRVEPALAELERCLSRVQQGGERWYLAELFRMKGELLIERDGEGAGSEWLERALETARAQGAEALVQRVEASLGRPVHGRG